MHPDDIMLQPLPSARGLAERTLNPNPNPTPALPDNCRLKRFAKQHGHKPNGTYSLGDQALVVSCYMGSREPVCADSVYTVCMSFVGEFA